MVSGDFPVATKFSRVTTAGLLHKTIGHGSSERIVKNDILEGNWAARGLNKWRGRQFKAKYRLQLIDRTNACGGAIPMRFIHYQYEIIEAREVIEVALANLFAEAANARGPATRTSELILEMLKMLMVVGNKFPPLAICRS
jgi:hypothetical protein